MRLPPGSLFDELLPKQMLIQGCGLADQSVQRVAVAHQKYPSTLIKGKMHQCKSISCDVTINDDQDFCILCRNSASSIAYTPTISMANKYPQYYKDVGDYSEIDVYAVHHLFNIQDPSGCIQHASKKLLLSGSFTDNKPSFLEITEARDTLNRWLELNPE